MTRNIMYSLIDNGDEQFITVIVPGEDPLVAAHTHPNFEAITDALATQDADPDDLIELFDVSLTVASKFTRLSERVSVANGRVYFDGDEQDDSITRQIVRFLSDGVGDWQPLVNFMENVAANPTEHSRTQLYDWLNAHDFTITNGGFIVGYKGVHKQADGTLKSGFSGSAIVNGQVVKGQIPNAVGSVIEMPRADVAHDPRAACSTGLHVGTYEYAKGYANGALLKVYVNPRDVVSVPTDAHGEKVRVCRYTVAQIIDAPVNTAVDYDDDADPEDAYEHGYFDGRNGCTYADTTDDRDYRAGYADGRHEWKLRDR